MANWQVISLDTTTPQLRAPGTGDGYSFNSGSTTLGTWTTTGLTLSTGTLTVSSGTANGVAYLNGSKVLTTGSALSFDGSIVTNTGVGFSVDNANALYRFRSAAGVRTGYLQARADAFDIWSDQAAVPIVFGVANAEAMRLTSTGLGIGTSSPGQKLDVSGAIRSVVSTGGTLLLGDSNNTTGIRSIQLSGDSGIGFYTQALNANNLRMTLDPSGNLGLGVTPSAWGIRALQMGAGSISASTAATDISANSFYDGTNFRYINSFRAVRYQQNVGAGEHYWFIAPSGTANTTTITNGVIYTIITSGNQTSFGAANNNVGTVFTATSSGTLSSGTVTQNVSFTQAMTLDASGNLLVGTTTTSTGNLNGSIFFGGADAGIVYLERQTGTDQLRFYVGGNRLGYLNTASSIVTLGTANYPLAFATNDTERARITSAGNVVVNTAAVATTATDGFLYIPTCAGAPTGVPTTFTGRSPLVVDSTNNRFYVYVNGAWKYATLT